MQYSLSFPTGTTRYIFRDHFEDLGEFIDMRNCILLVDSKVAEHHAYLFPHYKVIAIQADETQKSLSQLELVVNQLLKLEVHRKTSIVTVGGGLTTDLGGFIASTYMRGISFGYVPTTLLGMVDAAIGGKNGINLGLQKNLIGTIQQPGFILFDLKFLHTLPGEEWSNGFAEVIKYACLFDKPLFEELTANDINFYKNDPDALQLLIERCADWKNKVVMADEKEAGQRKLLNFGHTIGHAVETVHHLPHGFAVAIGMSIACRLSEEITGLAPAITQQLSLLLQNYGLPISLDLNIDQVMQVLAMDKKRNADLIELILLKDLGNPTIQPTPFSTIRETLEKHIYAGSR